MRNPWHHERAEWTVKSYRLDDWKPHNAKVIESVGDMFGASIRAAIGERREPEFPVGPLAEYEYITRWDWLLEGIALFHIEHVEPVGCDSEYLTCRCVVTGPHIVHEHENGWMWSDADAEWWQRNNVKV